MALFFSCPYPRKTIHNSLYKTNSFIPLHSFLQGVFFFRVEIVQGIYGDGSQFLNSVQDRDCLFLPM